MAKIRFIGLDLDGSLLDSHKKIDAETMSALLAADAQGVHLVPITGRPLEGIPKLVRELPFVRYIISCNGASIYDAQTRTVLRESLLSPALSLRLAALLGELQLPYEVLCAGIGYSEPWVYEQLIAMSPQNAFLPRYIKETRRLVNSLPAFIEAQKGLEELFVLAARRTAIAQLVERLADWDDLQVVHPAPGAVEITAAGVDKGAALLQLAAHLGISQAETMAIGDSGNDLAMLKVAGLSVAMGNADEDLKTLADFVTSSNDAQGVAQAIARFVLPCEN